MNRDQQLALERNRLERRCDALLASVPPTMVDDASRSTAIVREGEDVCILDAELAEITLTGMGLGALADEIAEERPRRPGTLPTVLVIEGWASCAFVRVIPMTAGGMS